MCLCSCFKRGSPTESTSFAKTSLLSRTNGTFTADATLNTNHHTRYIPGATINRDDSSEDGETGSPSQSLRSAISASNSTPNPLAPCLRILNMDKDLKVKKFYTITFYSRTNQPFFTIDKTKVTVGGFFASPTPTFSNRDYSVEMHPVKKNRIKITLGPTLEVSGIPTIVFYVTTLKTEHNPLNFKLDPPTQIPCQKPETAHFLRISPYELPSTDDDRL